MTRTAHCNFGSDYVKAVSVARTKVPGLGGGAPPATDCRNRMRMWRRLRKSGILQPANSAKRIARTPRKIMRILKESSKRSVQQENDKRMQCSMKQAAWPVSQKTNSRKKMSFVSLTEASSAWL